MSSGLPECKITVVKTTLHQDLIDEYLDDVHNHMGLCECFQDHQEFLVAPGEGVPEGFCPWAWADIRHDILTVAYGADIPGMRQPGTVITGCTDWFRPVHFKVERLDQSASACESTICEASPSASSDRNGPLSDEAYRGAAAGGGAWVVWSQ